MIIVLVAALAGGIAYLAITGRLSVTGASLTLPGSEVPTVATAPAEDPAKQPSMLAAPIAKNLPVDPEIMEDLSPAELLAKYPPDPSVAIAPGAAELAAWRRYGRASTVAADAPRLALLITGLGRNRADTVRAITGAPADASLSFDPDAAELADWIAAARAYGHEPLLDVPLRSNDAAGGLSTALGTPENLRRLDAILERAPMIAGIAVAGGESFLGDAAALDPILKRLHTAGLATIGLPITAPLTIGVDGTIPARSARDSIDASMRSAIALARRRGVAIMTVESSNVSDLLSEWYPALVGRDEISLVPVTAVVEE